MSTRDALIHGILRQPEPVLVELQHYLASLVERQRGGTRGIPIRSGEAWPARYFQKTAGALAGEPLERPQQLPS